MQIEELIEVAFVSSVRCGPETTMRVVAKGDSPVWSASLDGGLVTLKHKSGAVAYVPLTNVAYLQPKPPAPKAETKAKKA